MNEDLSTFEKFLLIGKDKKPLGVVSYQDAYVMAKKEGVDLVLVQVLFDLIWSKTWIIGNKILRSGKRNPSRCKITCTNR